MILEYKNRTIYVSFIYQDVIQDVNEDVINTLLTNQYSSCGIKAHSDIHGIRLPKKVPLSTL